MTTTSPTLTDDTGSPSARGKRRWFRRLVELVCAGIVVGAATLTAVGVSHYTPLKTGFLFGVEPWQMVHQTQDASSGSVVSGLTFTAGKDFSIEFDLINEGRFGVTVTGFPTDAPQYYERSTGIDMSSTDEGGRGGEPNASDIVPFHPFAVAPGHFRWIRLRFRFQDCTTKVSHESGSMLSTLEQFQLRFRIAGVSRTQWVALAEPVPIDISDVVSCPLP